MAGRSIPRIIHQICLGGSLPGELRSNVEKLKQRNRGWQHRLYGDREAEDFIARNYDRRVFDAFLKIDPRYGTARADLLRHLILYRSGGVYCDMRSTFDRPLDDCVRDSDTYLLAQWRNGPGEPNEGWGLHKDLVHVPQGEFMTHFIICQPGHAFSRAVIDKIVQNINRYRPWSAVGRTGVLRTTGPIAYTLAIWPILNQHKYRRVTPEELGARYWIGKMFKHVDEAGHYSDLDAPVVRLGKVQTLVSRPFVYMRRIKSAVGLGWRPRSIIPPEGLM